MRLEFTRPWVRFPVGLRCVFSSDPAVSSSIFVGAEREENLIRNDPEKSEFTTVILQIFGEGLFLVFSVVIDFTGIKKTPKREEYID